MRIFISGGGGEVDSKRLDNLFISTLSKSKITEIIYIPIASEEDKYQGCVDWFTGIFGERVGSIIPWLSLEGKTFDGLEKTAAVYVGGGNTLRLLSHIYQTKNHRSLINFIKNGGIYYGGSAGAIILGKSIKTAQEARFDNNQETIGLNILNGYSVACHCDKANVADNDYYADLSIKTDSPIIALTEKGGIYVKTGSFVTVDNKQSWVYHQGRQSSLTMAD